MTILTAAFPLSSAPVCPLPRARLESRTPTVKRWPRALLAEFVGTLAIVFVAAGVPSGPTVADRLAAAVAYGLAVTVAVDTLGGLSGGYFNPAALLAHWVQRRIGLLRLIGYTLAQLLGSLGAAWLLRWAQPESFWRRTALGSPALGSEITRAQAMVIEAVLAFLVVLPYAFSRRVRGWAVGGAVIAGVLLAAPWTGGALNPARAFGPQLLSHHWQNFGVWWIGPLGGGALAGWLASLRQPSAAVG